LSKLLFYEPDVPLEAQFNSNLSVTLKLGSRFSY